MSVGPIDAGMPRVAMLSPHDSFEVTGDTDLAPTDGSLGGKQKINQPGFSSILVEAVAHSAELGHDAAAKAQGFARGTYDDLHGTMIASQKADISVKLVGSIRNKLLESFQELWRVNV